MFIEENKIIDANTNEGLKHVEFLIATERLCAVTKQNQ
jgi:hypothetical protein